MKKSFTEWVEAVEAKGLNEVRKIPGFHDEPLVGKPTVRSVRLNGGFRACYEMSLVDGIEMLQVFSISNDHNNYCRK